MTARGLETLHYDAATTTSLAAAGPVNLIINLAMPSAREAARDADAALAQASTTAGLCAEMLAAGQAQRLLHLSTFHVYGGADSALYTEDRATMPGHPYGQTHLAVERILQDHAHADQIYILRATNMAGAPAHLDLGDQAGLIFLDLCRQAARYGQITLGNDGESYRDMLPFGDSIAALRTLAGPVDTLHRLFNMGGGQAVTLRTIAEMVQAGAPGTRIRYGTRTDAYRSPFTVDISRLSKLGWRPTRDLAKEVPATLEAFR